MASLRKGWDVQTRVLGALMMRELTTRFGRENIGFLWIMVEPLLFASLVGIMWRFMKGPEEHGIGIVAFVATGYIPMVLFRSSVSRAIRSIGVNASLMYHRQVTIQDLVLVRFLVELIGHMMAYLVIGTLLFALGLFPMPHDIGYVLLGWGYYSLFTLSLCFIISPLSEVSEVLEKIMPVVTYLMIPFSGAFSMVNWLSPEAAHAVLFSPSVHGMEMMRYGIFGETVGQHFSFFYPLMSDLVILAFGLAICRRVRRILVVE